MARRKQTDKLTISKIETLSIWDFDTSLKDLAEKIDEWRKQYGDDASLNFDYTLGYYDDVSLEVKLTWSRLETDEEATKRIEKNRKAREKAKKNRAIEKKRKAEQEKKDLAALIAKHPELAKEHLAENG